MAIDFTPQGIAEQRARCALALVLDDDAPPCSIALLKQFAGEQAAALDEIERLQAECAALREQVASMKAERDAAVSDIIPVCCRCKHFYRKSRGVYSCHKGGDMEHVYSWENDGSCEMWEWRGPCSDNAPEGAESERTRSQEVPRAD